MVVHTNFKIVWKNMANAKVLRHISYSAIEAVCWYFGKKSLPRTSNQFRDAVYVFKTSKVTQLVQTCHALS
jgi:hypothetical protein